VQIITDRNALAREAVAVLRKLPQVEEEDARIIVTVLAARLRNAAYWVIRREAEAIAELPQSLITAFTTLEDAEPLPDYMVFPGALSLAASRKNIYGIMPPAEEDLAKVSQILLWEEREWLADRRLALSDGELRIAKYDGAAQVEWRGIGVRQGLGQGRFCGVVASQPRPQALCRTLGAR